MNSAVAQLIGDLFNGDMPDDSDWLARLISNGLDRLPMPGSGSTLARWQALAAVGQFDLSLTKLYEGHTDALAIIAELEGDAARPEAGAWCVWAAEAPGGRTLLRPCDGGGDSGVTLGGAKFWCSGAASADHALLTAWAEDGSGPHLVALPLDQPGIRIDAGGWKAVGMASSLSVNVSFDGAKGRRIGREKAYLSRPGFWHGGAGIAACWYGGAVGLANALRKALMARPSSGDCCYQMASLGKVELALSETAATLRDAAQWIDSHPSGDASRVALRARLSAECCAKKVLDEVGKAMGATPFCLDEKFAKAAADLPVFIRQSHADRDFAALGERSLAREAASWTL
ncbi:acyl-CoA dehydrogenase [Polaromonas sp. YR568]|uniref:acyl-CoA dehydrogenase n=1 Tax=Polaromonas sp. YR568 TaxID=1855301 RepID=UPI00398BC215